MDDADEHVIATCTVYPGYYYSIRKESMLCIIPGPFFRFNQSVSRASKQTLVGSFCSCDSSREDWEVGTSEGRSSMTI